MAYQERLIERQKRPSMNVKTFKIIILLFCIAALFASVRFFHLGGYIDEGALRAWIGGFGALGPLVYILIYSIAPALMLPGLPLTIIGGILFGAFWGAIYTAVGATIGATFAFVISRYMGRGWVEEKLKGGKLEELDKEVRKNGWKVVAFTRLIPLFPYNFLNYAFGLTGIGLSEYVIATFIFMMPGIIAYVLFSSSILGLFKGDVSKGLLAGALLVAIVTLLPLLYKRYSRK